MYNLNLSEGVAYRAFTMSLETVNKTELSFVHPALVFVTESIVHVCMCSSVEIKKIGPGSFFLVPSGIACHATSEQNSTVIIMEIPDMNFIYMHYISCSLKVEPVDMDQVLCPLKIREPIGALLETIALYIEKNMSTGFLMGLKCLELFHFFKVGYPVEELHRFFTPILSDDYRFALFVMSNYRQVTSSKELCNLSNYSPTHFDRKFRKIFGESPYQWMLQKKIHDVYAEVKNTTKPLKVIADQYGFASVANFGDFCRKHFGAAPSALRKS